VQVLRDRAAQISQLDVVVVETVLQVGSELLAPAALAGLGDHNFSVDYPRLSFYLHKT